MVPTSGSLSSTPFSASTTPMSRMKGRRYAITTAFQLCLRGIVFSPEVWHASRIWQEAQPEDSMSCCSLPMLHKITHKITTIFANNQINLHFYSKNAYISLKNGRKYIFSLIIEKFFVSLHPNSKKILCHVDPHMLLQRPIGLLQFR